MVIVHPEFAMLILEVNNLKTEIANLIVERDMLNEYVCKDLEIDYTLKIGALEYKLKLVELEYAKNKRKFELINEKLKKNEKINISAIDKKVNSELKDEMKYANEMSMQIDFAVEVSALELFDYDLIDELNLQYYKLQRLYNPIFDLEPKMDKIKMYQKIERYYQKNDLKKLTKLAKDYDEDDLFQDEISVLKKYIEKYEDDVYDLKKEIRRIKNTFPYNQKVILQDENLCRRKKDNINFEISRLNTENRKIKKKIDDKLKKM